jgi:hypothetical protein
VDPGGGQTGAFRAAALHVRRPEAYARSPATAWPGLSVNRQRIVVRDDCFAFLGTVINVRRRRWALR